MRQSHVLRVQNKKPVQTDILKYYCSVTGLSIYKTEPVRRKRILLPRRTKPLFDENPVAA